MRRWWLLIALLLSAGVNVGILATLLAQRGHKGAGEASPPRESAPLAPAVKPNVAPLADRLGLAGETRTRFVETQERFVATMREQRFRRLQLQAELRAELLSEQPDRARIDQLTKQLGEAYGSLDRALADNILETRTLLTPAQQRQFLRFVQSRLEQLHGERPPGPGPLRNRPWPARRRFSGGGMEPLPQP